MKEFKFLLISVLIPLMAHAASQGQEGGGGSQIELDFVQVARYASIGIQQSLTDKEGLFDGFDLSAFQKAVGSVEVHQVQNLCALEVDPYTGATVQRCLDASYSPDQNQIQLSADNWVKKSCTEKMSLAVHEFGRASGNENGDYDYSSKVALSPAMAGQCVPYENQAGEPTFSCGEKASYLEQSLHAIDSVDISTPTGVTGYIGQVTSAMNQWSSGFGKGCVAEGEAACIKVCFLKVGSSCFGICG